MHLRTSILLLSVVAAACTAETTAPLAAPADVSRDEAAADSTAAPSDPSIPDSKGSVLPSVRVPPESKGSTLPSI